MFLFCPQCPFPSKKDKDIRGSKITPIKLSQKLAITETGLLGYIINISLNVTSGKMESYFQE